MPVKLMSGLSSGRRVETADLEPKQGRRREKTEEMKKRGEKKPERGERREGEVNLEQISIVTEQESRMRRVVTGSG